jgi:hypothetical protein
MDHDALMMIAGSQKNIGMTVLLSQDKRPIDEQSSRLAITQGD